MNTMDVEKMAWPLLRRHGWRVCKDDPDFFYYRGDQTLNLWHDHTTDEVVVELGRWAWVRDEKGSNWRHFHEKDWRVPLAGFGKESIGGLL